jgi:dTDP-4-amino-4,6-dideoxygalactose transaminase
MLVLNDHVVARREVNSKFRKLLENVPGISFQSNPNSDFESNMWLTSILIDPEKAGFTREELRLAMEDANIETRPLWKPMHLQPVFEKYPFYGNGTSEKLFDNGLCLPSHPSLSNDDIERVVGVIINLFSKN